MHDATDMELLREYAQQNSESAFATLVSRHVNLVYSAALRKTGNPHAAEEITQAVFIILAQKAGRISKKTILPGWLYQTARLTAANYLKREMRRTRREQEAYMQTELHATVPDETWDQLAPLLEDAMGQLVEKDRAALVLRFFRDKSFAEVAAASGVSENAAKKRVNHALEKLHRYFYKRGVTSTAVVIAGAISGNSVQAAPISLASSVTAAAMTKGATLGGSTLALVRGTIKIMTWLQFKFAVGVGMAAVLAASVATVAISQSSGNSTLTPQQIAKQSEDTYAALSSYSDSGTGEAEGGGTVSKTTSHIRLQRPNLYRVDWTQTDGLSTNKGIIWSDGYENYSLTARASQETNTEPQTNSLAQTFASAGAVSGSVADSIPVAFFNLDFGNVLGVAALGRSELKKEGDEKVGGVDCYVLSSKIDLSSFADHEKPPTNTGTTTSTFWIGKRDHLIRQIRTVSEGMSLRLPPQSDATITAILKGQNKPVTPEAIAAWRTKMDDMMKQAQGTKFIFTQTHENISVNQQFLPSDFYR
jgi:RNA polymerase sigma factor (sigma-70 family)